MEAVYQKRVSYHETDCMGVVHHANYAKYFEDARVEYLYQTKLEAFHAPQYDYALALTSMEVSFLKPLRLFDEISVHLEAVALSSTKFQFSYEIHSKGLLVTKGKTTHVGLNSELKVVKPPVEFLKNIKVQENE